MRPEEDPLTGGAYKLGRDAARRISDEVWEAMRAKYPANAVGSMSASITADTTEFNTELRRAKAMLGVVGVAVPMPDGAEVRPDGTVWGAET